MGLKGSNPEPLDRNPGQAEVRATEGLGFTGFRVLGDVGWFSAWDLGVKCLRVQVCQGLLLEGLELSLAGCFGVSNTGTPHAHAPDKVIAAKRSSFVETDTIVRLVIRICVIFWAHGLTPSAGHHSSGAQTALSSDIKREFHRTLCTVHYRLRIPRRLGFPGAL